MKRGGRQWEEHSRRREQHLQRPWNGKTFSDFSEWKGGQCGKGEGREAVRTEAGEEDVKLCRAFCVMRISFECTRKIRGNLRCVSLGSKWCPMQKIGLRVRPGPISSCGTCKCYSFNCNFLIYKMELRAITLKNFGEN